MSVLPYHPPIQYAKQLATLDVVSKGRLILGVGTGWFEEEFERLGLPFADRGAMTDEYLRAMIELWTSDRPAFSGKYVSFQDVTFLPKPVQKPHMPIFVGGTGTRPAHRTAELGAGWHPMVGTFEERAAFFQRVKQLTAERGRDPEALWFTGNVDLSLDPATQQATRHVSADRYATFSALDSAEVIAAIEQERAAGVESGLDRNAVGHRGRPHRRPGAAPRQRSSPTSVRAQGGPRPPKSSSPSAVAPALRPRTRPAGPARGAGGRAPGQPGAAPALIRPRAASRPGSGVDATAGHPSPAGGWGTGGRHGRGRPWRAPQTRWRPTCRWSRDGPT